MWTIIRHTSAPQLQTSKVNSSTYWSVVDLLPPAVDCNHATKPFSLVASTAATMAVTTSRTWTGAALSTARQALPRSTPTTAAGTRGDDAACQTRASRRSCRPMTPSCRAPFWRLAAGWLRPSSSECVRRPELLSLYKCDSECRNRATSKQCDVWPLVDWPPPTGAGARARALPAAGSGSALAMRVLRQTHRYRDRPTNPLPTPARPALPEPRHDASRNWTLAKRQQSTQVYIRALRDHKKMNDAMSDSVMMPSIRLVPACTQTRRVTPGSASVSIAVRSVSARVQV